MKFDVLIIGCGASGMLAALNLAQHGLVVGLVNKSEFDESNTYWAQGGIAGVADVVKDSIADHVADTLRAGAGLCNANAVEQMVAQSGSIIARLLAMGIPFDHHSGVLHLTREAGHERPRIVHVQDATGRAVSDVLRQQVFANTNIHYLANHTAIDIITQPITTGTRACGVYLLHDQQILTATASHTILATGGAGKCYMYTTNPHAATGDGIAMAWRVGCAVSNMEMMQFHPTTLYHAEPPSMLLTEALRGEGALLVDSHGRRFMTDYDAERMELAPRDIVARAIDHEIKKQGVDCMYLDARPLGADTIKHHFPNIQQRLQAIGLDFNHAPIPIVPAAHYLCGGVQTDLAGSTSIQALYVIGEAACTGVHGANRLASNSLLECLVMAELCSQQIISLGAATPTQPVAPWDDSGLENEPERVQIKQNWDEIRAVMSNYVGLVRSNKRLRRARRRLRIVEEEIADYYWRHPLSRDLIELRNLAQVASLTIRSALERKESRGLHYSLDYPHTLESTEDTVLKPADTP
ncbi:MAG: L-aspartate oxidase [Mariprofundales bacterium]